ncbi:LysR family transcriptional regulator [Iodobacter sp.]|uniref:LysR family transcriptional regulator n=1 Tax=Iodobacter sp. TaxID=1915058 RepID=UPI0025E7B0C9|nr:LysR family transcriptional regulator [Iodobacter sp.]
MDWNNVRYFLAIYKTRTLAAAAQLLSVDQATVGRRLSALERQLNTRLFLRTTIGMLPTPFADQLLPHALQLEDAALAMQKTVQDSDMGLAGLVRIATTDTLAQSFVIPAIQSLQEQHPDIELVLLTGAELLNLSRREADIALRTIRPESPLLIARKLMELTVSLYGSAHYWRTHAMPVRGEHFAGHSLLLPLQATGWSEPEQLAGEAIDEGKIRMRCNTLWSLCAATRAGLGITELPDFVAHEYPELQAIWTEHRRHYPVWLVAHPDLYKTARIRAVMDAICAVATTCQNKR